MSALGVCAQELIAFPALPLNSDVVFLCDFEGLDFATTAVDRSPKAASLKFSGQAHLDTLVKKYGTASLANVNYPGSGVTVAADPDYNIITGDFTVEGYIYFTSFGSQPFLAGVYSGSQNQGLWSVGIGAAQIFFEIRGSNLEDVRGDHTMVVGQWYHVAVCRIGSIVRFFQDGVMIGRGFSVVRSTVSTDPTIGLSIGSDWDGLSTIYTLDGWADSVRITKAAWYRTDASFTPPLPQGLISPGLFVDTDVFYDARISPYSLAPSLFVDTDTFHVPKISPQILRPTSLIVDTDTFYVPKVKNTTVWGSVQAVTLSGSNLIATSTGTTSTSQGVAIPTTAERELGLIQWEITTTTIGGADYGFGVGVPGSSFGNLGTTATTGVMLYSNGHIWANGTDLGALLSGFVNGDIYAVALHLGRRLIWFKKVSGTPSNWNGDPTADPATFVGGIAVPSGSIVPCGTFGGAGGTAGRVLTANFGQSSFTGSLTAGYERGWVGDL